MAGKTTASRRFSEPPRLLEDDDKVIITLHGGLHTRKIDGNKFWQCPISETNTTNVELERDVFRCNEKSSTLQISMPCLQNAECYKKIGKVVYEGQVHQIASHVVALSNTVNTQCIAGRKGRHDS